MRIWHYVSMRSACVRACVRACVLLVSAVCVHGKCVTLVYIALVCASDTSDGVPVCVCICVGVFCVHVCVTLVCMCVTLACMCDTCMYVTLVCM